MLYIIYNIYIINNILYILLYIIYIYIYYVLYILYKSYFSKPFERSGRNIKVELDLFSYAAKTGLNSTAGVDTSNLAVKLDFFSLKANVNKKDIGKLKTIPADLYKLSNVVDNDVIKKNYV